MFWTLNQKITTRTLISCLVPLQSTLYSRHVFLGLALLELGEYDESEHVNFCSSPPSHSPLIPLLKVYRKATRLNPSQALAWQVRVFCLRQSADKTEETFRALQNSTRKETN